MVWHILTIVFGAFAAISAWCPSPWSEFVLGILVMVFGFIAAVKFAQVRRGGTMEAKEEPAPSPQPEPAPEVEVKPQPEPEPETVTAAPVYESTQAEPAEPEEPEKEEEPEDEDEPAY